MLFASLAVVVGLFSEWSTADEPDKSVVDSMLGTEAGDVRDENGLKMKLVWCPPGFVDMEEVREVARNGTTETVTGKIPALLTRGYWLGKYEVSQAEWTRLMLTQPWKGGEWTENGPDVPATFVSWDDANRFCRRFTERERKAGRLPEEWEYTLPTEAQWERACRARTDTRFSFGRDDAELGEYAWFRENAWNVGEKYAHRVGQKKSNPWGLNDMHGNVWEWCRDSFAERLPGGRDPEDLGDGSQRVIRGGGWGDEASNCRSGFRDQYPPSNRDYSVGFRVALTPIRPAK